MEIRVNSKMIKPADEKRKYSWKLNPKKTKKKSGGIFSYLYFSIVNEV